MPSVATGAVVANRKTIAIGVSGDGDTGAIGVGQFVHLMRRKPADGLRHRGQRLLRSDQGPVFADGRHGFKAQDRRRQRFAAARHLRARHRARRVVRGPVLLGGFQAAQSRPQGGPQPSWYRAHRRALAVCHVQRPRRLDQELFVRQGARRAGCRHQLRPVLRRHLSRVRPRYDDRGHVARWVEGAS